MGIRIDLTDDWVEYVPDVLGNRADLEPTTMEIHPMSASELRSFQARYGSSLRGKQADKRAAQLVRRVLTERVRNIQNCYVQRQICTGEELAEYGLSALIDDVFTAIMDLSHLQEGLKKKFDSPCVSPRRAVQLPDGAMSDAVYQDPTG
jgi:hypothetical protein